MEAEKKISVKVDAGEITGKLEHNWRYIGYDECNYTHAPEGEELLAKFGSLADGPYYIRAHHMLCTGNCHGTYKWGSTNAYTEDEHGNPVYNWEVIDLILDTYLKNHCKPFIELGFMPLDLVDMTFFEGENEWSLYGKYKSDGWAQPPKDYKKWHDLVCNLVKHCVERYGSEEVLTWYWELWNEPDIFYWKGTVDEFCKLYDYTEAAVHSVLRDARLGGPATTGPWEGPGSSLEFLDRFLNHCRNGINFVLGEKGTRLDYVTFHTKGGGFPFKINAPKATPSVQSMVNQVRLGLEAVKKYGYSDHEVILSEADPDGWAAGGRFDNPNMNFRNTEYYASFVASSYHHIEKLAKSMGMDVRPLAWAFMFTGERCFEGTRTFTTQGIDKPVFNLFKMYARMGDRSVFFTNSQKIDLLQGRENTAEPDVSGMASISNDGRIQIIIYSHHDDWDFNKVINIELEIGNLVGKSISMKHYRIDKTHSNAYTEWVLQGGANYPSKQVYDKIKAKDDLELFEPERTIDVLENKAVMRFILPTHAVSMIEIAKV